MQAPPSSDTQKAKRAGVAHAAQLKGRGGVNSRIYSRLTETVRVPQTKSQRRTLPSRASLTLPLPQGPLQTTLVWSQLR